jgi:hypothetical protein
MIIKAKIIIRYTTCFKDNIPSEGKYSCGFKNLEFFKSGLDLILLMMNLPT